MEPGVPGLLALLAAALLGAAIAKFATARMMGHASASAASLATASIFLVGVGTVFWFWASFRVLMYNIPDFGVVSFLVANVINYRTADLCAVLARRPGRRQTLRSLTQQHITQPIANVLVAANYWLALLLPRRPGGAYTMYIVVGGAFWAGAALRVCMLHAACGFGGMTDSACGASGDDLSRAPLKSAADAGTLA